MKHTLFDLYPKVVGLYLNPDEVAQIILFGTDDSSRESDLLFRFIDRLNHEAKIGTIGVKLWNPEHLDTSQIEPPPRISVYDAMMWSFRNKDVKTSEEASFWFMNSLTQ